jgi:uncharacterized protein YdhG (YjbR/CyaY superfamily)
VSREDIDGYLASVEEPKRSTLEALRRSILAVVPDAEECLSYGVPGFRVNGTVVAGFAAAKKHLSYFPHSGSLLDQIDEELDGYDHAKGTLRFPIDEPLPDALVEKLLSIRISMMRATDPD